MEILRRVDGLGEAVGEVRHDVRDARESVSELKKMCAICPARIGPAAGKMWTQENIRLALVLGLVIMLSMLGADGVKALLTVLAAGR